VAVPNAQGACREVRALPKRAPVERRGANAPDGEVGQPCVGEGMTSSKSPVREPSTLVRRVRRGNVVKVETETPALWRQPPETATPSTLD